MAASGGRLLGAGEAVRGLTGLDDEGPEGEPVHYSSRQPGVGEGLAPLNWGSHAFVLTVRPSEQAVLVCSEDR